jgi:hypothetical protein
MSVEVVLSVARELGIAITHAPTDSEVFECWADRVALARVYARQGESDLLAQAVAEANRYAVE